MAIIREDHRELLSALASLPPEQREALVLRYWPDLSMQEIAQTMSVSAGTVKTHISRGLAIARPQTGVLESMNRLEEDLAEALRKHAEGFTPSPDGWERTQARM